VGGGLSPQAAGDFVSGVLASEAVISNLGALPFESSYGALKVEALWGPAVLSASEGRHTIGAATVNGELCLTLTSQAPPNGLLEAMQTSLIRACSI
jgi:hypothetical protein